MTVNGESKEIDPGRGTAPVLDGLAIRDTDITKEQSKKSVQDWIEQLGVRN